MNFHYLPHHQQLPQVKLQLFDLLLRDAAAAADGENPTKRCEQTLLRKGGGDDDDEKPKLKHRGKSEEQILKVELRAWIHYFLTRH